MFRVLPLSKKLQNKIDKYGLRKKTLKAMALLASDFQHPGLHTELLEPKENGFYSFRLDIKYRGIFIIHQDGNTIQIIGITNHYH